MSNLIDILLKANIHTKKMESICCKNEDTARAWECLELDASLKRAI
jgi:hypothetical protein